MYPATGEEVAFSFQMAVDIGVPPPLDDDMRAAFISLVMWTMEQEGVTLQPGEAFACRAEGPTGDVTYLRVVPHMTPASAAIH